MNKLINLPTLKIQGTSIDDIASGAALPPWMAGVGVPQQLQNEAQALLNFKTGGFVGNIANSIISVLFRPQKWSIGGVLFDGVMKTTHSSHLEITEFQTKFGTGADHAVVKPASLNIEVMMSDTISNGPANNPLVSLQMIYSLIKNQKSLSDNFFDYLSNYLDMNLDLSKKGRSAAAWTVLKALQLSRTPLTVETRLGTYNNMMIDSLSTTDDIDTLYALKANVSLKEILKPKAQSVAPGLEMFQYIDAGYQVAQAAPSFV